MGILMFISKYGNYNAAYVKNLKVESFIDTRQQSAVLATFQETFSVQHSGVVYFKVSNDQRFGPRPTVVKKNNIEVANDNGTGEVVGVVDVRTGDAISIDYQYGIADITVLLCYY